MKNYVYMKLITVLLSLSLFSCASFAQNAHHTTMKEGIKKIGDKMWVIKKMTDSMTLDNGLIVSTDGTITLKKGNSYKMEDGECMSLAGKMTTLNSRDGVDGILVKNNVMWVYTILSEPLTLGNGNDLTPEGTIEMPKNGKKIKLHDKDFVDMQGNIASR